MTKTIGILLISTNKYEQFVQPLVNDINKYFFVNYPVEVHLFTDNVSVEYESSDRVKIIKHSIPSYKFPFATLYRYKIFTEYADQLQNCSHIFYSDVDMSICDFVGEEMLPDGVNDEGLTAILHPGFYNGGGSWGNDKNSLSYTLPKNRKNYYCGGVQGGVTKNYLEVCKILSEKIADDESRGVMAEWHDETFWNFYLSSRKPKTLDPSYCMVEQFDLRAKWGISHFNPKIVALAKNHEELRK